MKALHPLFSVIIPVYNEVLTLDALLNRVQHAPYPHKEILVVDDGSSDGSAAILNAWRDRPGFRIFHHSHNQGKGAAVRTALVHAQGDFTLIQDADLEYDPNEYPRLLDAAQRNAGAAVYGSRYLAPTQPLPWSKFRIAVCLLNWLVRLLYGQRLTDEATCYKLLPTDLLRALDLQAQRFELCAEITAKLGRWGVPIVEVPIRYAPRGYGDGKKIGWRDAGTTLATLLRWRFARFPHGRSVERVRPRLTVPRTSSAAGWFLGLTAFCAPLLFGCGKSDDKLFQEAAQKAGKGEMEFLDARSFPKIGDAQLALLSGAENLKSLNLDGSAITDEGLKQLPSLPNLTDLSLSNTQISDAGLEGLRGLSHLQYLRLDGTRVKDPGLYLVADLGNLKNLSLWKCVVGDAGMAYLSKLHNLERLSLDETRVTDAGLKHLTSLARLQYLSLWQTKVSDAGIGELRRALPSVQINR